MPVITLPDGSQRPFDQPVTVHEVAADIGPGLAKAALAGVVDGREVDTSFTIEQDATLAIITERDDAGLEVIPCIWNKMLLMLRHWTYHKVPLKSVNSEDLKNRCARIYGI